MADAYDFWAARLGRDEALRVDAFWDRFARAAPRIDRHLRGMAAHVDPDREARVAFGDLASRLYWDFEMAEDGTRRLVVTAELRHSSRVLARAVANRFPGLAGWSVSDARLPVVAIPAAVSAILYRSRSEAMAVEEIAPRRAAHRLIDLTATGRGDAAFLADQAGIVFSVLLGDRADQDWLGETRVRPIRRGGLRERLFAQPVPLNDRWLSDFRGAAVEIIAGLEADRPEAPLSETRFDAAEAALYRLSADPSDPARRHDMMSCRSRYPAMTAARLAGVRIGAARFSRFGESFCGLKIRRTQMARLDAEGALDDLGRAVEAALAPAGLGALTALGQGAAHVYLDLALLRIEEAVQALRRTLREQGIEAPAWLIFDEAGLEDRYLPITPGTPPTPLA